MSKYRVYGVVSERTKLPEVWIGTLIEGTIKDGILELKTIFNERKQIHTSECQIDKKIS